MPWRNQALSYLVDACHPKPGLEQAKRYRGLLLQPRGWSIANLNAQAQDQPARLGKVPRSN